MNSTATVRLAPSSYRRMQGSCYWSLASSPLCVALITGPLVIFLDPLSPHLCLLKLSFCQALQSTGDQENKFQLQEQDSQKKVSQLLFLLETWQGME